MAEATSTRSLSELYFELGRALAASGRRDEAIEAFEHAGKEADDAPAGGALLIQVGESLEGMHETSPALRSYLRAAQADPMLLDEALERAHGALSRRLATVDGTWIRSEWAKSILGAGLKSHERGDVAFFLGRVDLYLEEYASAQKLFEEAGEARPDDARVLEGLGEALWRTRELDRAVAVLERARELADAGDRERVPLIDGKLAQVLSAAGRFEDALERIGDTVDERGPYADELLLISSECQLAVGNPEDAFRSAERAVERRPRAAAAHLARARALVALGRFDEAVAAVERASQLDPSSNEPLAAKAQVLIEGQLDLEHGVRLLTSLARRISPDDLVARTHALVFPGRSEDGDARHFFARVLAVLERHDQALAEVEEALRLGLEAVGDYSDAPAEQLKAVLLEELGRSGEAADSFRSAGLDFYWRDDYASAKEELGRAVELRPDEVITYWYLADAIYLMSYGEPDDQRAAERLEEAVQAWERGAARSLPDVGFSWAYTSRALISERRADLGVADDWSERWEAIAYLERALVLGEENQRRWIVLSRVYRSLGLDGSAAQASGRAVELGPEEKDALEERAAALANVGRFAECLEAIDLSRSLATEPDPWADALRAYVLLRMGKIDEALDLLEGSISAAPDNLWYRELRALARWIQHDREGARADNEAIWSRREEGDRDVTSFASAAYQLELYDEAQKLFTQLLGDRLNREVARRYLAFTTLAHSDVEEGERQLGELIDSMVNPRDLQDLVQFELGELGERLAGTERAEAIARLAERALGRRQEVGEVLPLPELEELAADEEAMAAVWVRVGVLAAIARHSVGAGELERAEALYAELGRAEGARGIRQFPEAGLAEARVAATRGLAAARAGKPQEAVEAFQRSLSLRLSSGDPSAADSLVDDASATAADADYHALVSTARILERKAEDEQARELRSSRLSQAVGRYARARRPLSDGAEPPVAWTPPSPLVLEADSRLFPQGEATPEVGRMLQEYIPAMRERVQARTGVPIPGVQIRPREGPAGEYRVLVHEVPVYTARLSDEEWGGSPYELMVQRLGDVVIGDHVAAFTGVQETADALVVWTLAGDVAERERLRAEAVPDRSALVRLARVLRGLAAEGVPIADLERILRAFAEAGPETTDVQAVVELVRLALANVLPGRSEAVPLPPELEDAVASHVVERSGKRFLAVPALEANRLLQDAAAQLADVPAGGAVVVRTPGLRPFVRRLLADELPGVYVLAAAETEAA